VDTVRSKKAGARTRHVGDFAGRPSARPTLREEMRTGRRGDQADEAPVDGHDRFYVKKYLILEMAACDRRLSRADVGVFAAIAHHFWEGDRYCFPSYKDIAARAATSQRNAVRSVAQLARYGYIELVVGAAGRNKGGHGRSNRYRPRLEAVTATSPYKRKGDTRVTAKSDRAVTAKSDRRVTRYRFRDSDSKDADSHLRARATATSGKSAFRDKGEPSRPGRDDDAPVWEAVSAWNGLAERVGLPVATAKSPSLVEARRKRLKARLVELGGLDGWNAILAKIEASGFLTGKVNDFRASLDWILKPANLAKITEGNFDDRPRAARRGSAVEAAFAHVERFSKGGRRA